MHDPMTQILDGTGFILWHVDPGYGGSDDSCNWSGYRNNLTEAERDWLRKEGESEWGFWFRGVEQSDNPGHYWTGSMVPVGLQPVPADLTFCHSLRSLLPASWC
jgi:hypothetical protein